MGKQRESIEFLISENIRFRGNDLGTDLNELFLRYYKKYLLGEKFDENEFIRVAHQYFDKAVNDHNAHDKFFENFTVLTESNPDFFLRGEIWDFSLYVVSKWEEKNQNFRIHKGTPYHFKGITYLKYGDYINGFISIHQAVNEDVLTKGKDHPDTPGFYFVTLNYEQSVYGKELVDEISQYLEEKILKYKSERKGVIELNSFKTSFLENYDDLDIVISFVYLLFIVNKIERKIEEKLRRNDFASLIEVGHIFDLCLVIDSFLRTCDGEKYFSGHLDYMIKKGLLHMTSDQTKREWNSCINADFEKAIVELLDGKFCFVDGSRPSGIDADFLLAYGFRNHGAHNIEAEGFICDRFSDIIQRILNTLFYFVEKMM
jgi:hypothetical protein